MRKFYLAASILLAGLAAWAATSIFNYSSSSNVQKFPVYEPIAATTIEADQSDPKDSAAIYEKNAFDKLRGKELRKASAGPTPPNPVRFSFEMRGIHILGEKKMALIGAEPVNNKSRTSAPAKLIRVGEELPGTGYKVASIEPGKVNLQNSSGAGIALNFDITSAASLKRAEAVYKKKAKKVATPGN